MIAVEYAPYSALFPRACAIVSSAGVGTVGQILRAGKPALLMPFAHDQQDNADRLRRLGVGRVITPKRYKALHGAAEILRLVGENLYPGKAKEIGLQVQQEEGLKTACDHIEQALK
jgi:UDP:flavonoid glycosyltransferase YjiC (YdhE family)